MLTQDDYKNLITIVGQVPVKGVMSDEGKYLTDLIAKLEHEMSTQEPEKQV